MTREYQYDAFIVCNPVGYDLQFVKELAGTMEAPPYNFRFFIPWRDDVGGSIGRHHYLTVTADLIENRCRKTIAVLSHNFWKSETALFQLNHAHCISPGNRLKKIIPICLDDCLVPTAIKQITRIHYNRTDMKDWFWSRVTEALRRPDDVTVSCDQYTCSKSLETEESYSSITDSAQCSQESREFSGDLPATSGSVTANEINLPDIVLDTDA